MITIRKSNDRGHFDHGWLDTRHTFSFAGYQDPRHMGFRKLRVINEDRVVPGAGFPTHGHQDMEILTWVLDGALEHADSMGNGSKIGAGEMQRMSAGSGVTHSEYNASKESPVHFMQIWVLPANQGTEPGYEQRRFDPAEGKLTLLASGRPGDDAVTVDQDVRVYAARLQPAQEVEVSLDTGRAAWVQVTRGRIRLDGEELEAGDGAAVEVLSSFKLTGLEAGEALVFDLG